MYQIIPKSVNPILDMLLWLNRPWNTLTVFTYQHLRIYGIVFAKCFVYRMAVEPILCTEEFFQSLSIQYIFSLVV